MLRVVPARQAGIAAAILAAASAVAMAQATPAAGSAAPAPDVGQVAPDFSLPGATRFGLLKDAVKLSDYKGQTVVLAFFPKARTKG
jgi:peroxiredoxin Q/BCP